MQVKQSPEQEQQQSGPGDQHDQRQGEAERDEDRHGQGSTQNVMNRHHTGHVRDIRTTITAKHNQIFMLTSHTGDMERTQQAMGVYFRDTEYLDVLHLRLNGEPCLSVLADGTLGHAARYELTNVEFTQSNGERLEQQRIAIHRSYQIENSITHTLRIRNMAKKAVQFDLSLRFGSHFADMMVVRGHPPGQRGTINPARVEEGKLILSYSGMDHHLRTTTISFEAPPLRIEETTAIWPLALDAKQEITLSMTIELADQGPPSPWERREGERHITLPSATVRHQQFVRELEQRPTIQTSNALFDRALERSFSDIAMLATADHGDVYIAGGIPWFATLFGRDSCTSAFQMVAYTPELAKTTLEALARYQGRELNNFRDESPGKILHELRLGQKANLEEIPQVPYYGTVDATPWFLMVLAEYIRWTGDLDIFTRMGKQIRAALDWIDANPTRHAHGPGDFLQYGTRSEQGLTNQGWKDSDNAIVYEDGAICAPPIALVEVQGYAYRAEREMADLYRRYGDERAAHALDEQAERMRTRFNDAFWMPGTNFYALCLARDNRPSKAIASNPGQALFTGIADPEKARLVVERLMKPDMFAGWGIRTLSSEEPAYNPLDYQVGAFWPHDNSLIALGFWEYGYTKEAAKIFTGIFQAAQHFVNYRLPEVFDGFSQDEFERPVHYPVACSPQAWAAGALPLLLRVALGLKARALEQRLIVHHPHLPPWLEHVTIAGLKVGQATVDLEYRLANGHTTVLVTGRTGELDVHVEY